MKEVLQKINELYDILTVRLKKVSDELQEIANTKKDLVAREEYINAKEKSLSEREKKVSEIENLLKLKNDIVEREKAVKTAKIVLAKEKEDFEAYRAKNEKLINDKLADIDRRFDKLKKAQLALDEDKKTYRIKIFNEVVSKYGKRD